MEITQQILAASSILGAVAVIFAAACKLIDWLRKPGQQDRAIQELHDKHDADMKELREEDAKRHAEIQNELQVLCYGLRGALQGLVEGGYNGPCKDALKALDKHLNKSAHEP